MRAARVEFDQRATNKNKVDRMRNQTKFDEVWGAALDSKFRLQHGPLLQVLLLLLMLLHQLRIRLLLLMRSGRRVIVLLMMLLLLLYVLLMIQLELTFRCDLLQVSKIQRLQIDVIMWCQLFQCITVACHCIVQLCDMLFLGGGRRQMGGLI